MLDLLDIITIERLAQLKSQNIKVASVEDAMDGSFADISQSHARRTYSHRGTKMFTITTSTNLYSFTHDSIILPEEMYTMHGFSRSLSFPSHLTIGQQQNLVGNGMAAPCLAQILSALYILLCKYAGDVD